jgi:hypothetical protein
MYTHAYGRDSALPSVVATAVPATSRFERDRRVPHERRRAARASDGSDGDGERRTAVTRAAWCSVATGWSSQRLKRDEPTCLLHTCCPSRQPRQSLVKSHRTGPPPLVWRTPVPVVGHPPARRPRLSHSHVRRAANCRPRRRMRCATRRIHLLLHARPPGSVLVIIHQSTSYLSILASVLIS